MDIQNEAYAAQQDLSPFIINSFTEKGEHSMGANLISIVLPTRNGSRYLARSIESCLSQTYSHIELIIVNDCSTDNSLAIAESYAKKDSRVSVISNETNLKLPASLNIGFAASRGEYLTWTSDDNYYKENAIDVMADALSRKSNVGLVYADMWIVNENSEIITYSRSGFKGAVSDLPIYNAVGGCFLYERNVYETVGEYDATKELVEDWDYWMRIWAKFEVSHLPYGLYYYRQHGASLTGRRFTEQQKAAVDFIKESNARFGDKISDDIKLRAFLRCAGIAMRIERKDIARECMELALSISADAREYTYKELVEYAAGV